MVLKYTIGIRLTLEEEQKGSDEVEHNIKEETIVNQGEEKKHSLGKKLSHAGLWNTAAMEEMRKKSMQEVRKKSSAAFGMGTIEENHNVAEEA